MCVCMYVRGDICLWCTALHLIYNGTIYTIIAVCPLCVCMSVCGRYPPRPMIGSTSFSAQFLSDDHIAKVKVTRGHLSFFLVFSRSKVKFMTFGVSKSFWSRKNAQIRFESCTHIGNITENIVWNFRHSSKVKVIAIWNTNFQRCGTKTLFKNRNFNW